MLGVAGEQRLLGVAAELPRQPMLQLHQRQRLGQIGQRAQQQREQHTFVQAVVSYDLVVEVGQIDERVDAVAPLGVLAQRRRTALDGVMIGDEPFDEAGSRKR